MSYPRAPPPYDDKNPLYPPQPGGHPQPGAYPGGYPQPVPYPGSYPQPGGYPGGYPQPGGYPHPDVLVPLISTLPMNQGNICILTSLGDDVVRTIDWDDKRVRHAFIRKVYTIISIQLLVTVGIIAVFTFVSPVRTFVQGNVIVYYASYAVFLVSYLVLACCPGPRRCFPCNLILLAIFTLAMAFMTGTIASTYDTMAVLIAMVITAKVAIIVTIFCFQTKVDFTSCTGLFCVLGIVILLTSIVSAIVLYYKYSLSADSVGPHGVCGRGCDRLHPVPSLRHPGAGRDQGVQPQPRGVRLRRPGDLRGHRLHLLVPAAVPGL
ncbi:protein lifeguard 3 isoform X1 [Caretta caretta]|uniref:protein lifeguard 3 isoform X1 n=1 Tax=Caretta caretta TaxID=8467 RepID=UPI003F4C8E6D